MTVGLIPNISKENIVDVISVLAKKLGEFQLDFLISDSLLKFGEKIIPELKHFNYRSEDEVFNKSDIVFSIGGDGTMLSTAHRSLEFGTPILGLNMGKLGFLAEYDISGIGALLTDLINEKYNIEERIVLESDCLSCSAKKFFSINDIVIDKGSWPKMIEISVRVDEDDVTTFYADGLILATPTGSTGYSLSTGGPVVDPKADVITLSPISPHTLTMRPLVLASSQKIYLTVKSHHTDIYVNSDGQQVQSYTPPVELLIYKSEKKVKLVRTNSSNYFKTLREKLYWGLDFRNNSSGR
jgi:NAD+ kinase